ncbi:MAG TPA: hypothetical protein VGE51_11655 [Fontimonas sp.]
MNTFESLEVVPAVAGQGSEIPAGTSLRFRALATYTQTVPPGTKDSAGNTISSIETQEDVSNLADWTSSAATVASVEDGLVEGLVASSVPVSITASFENRTDSVQVTVTDAIIEGVEYVKPASLPRTANNTYTVAVDGTYNFEIYGRFSDSQVRQLTGANYVVAWSSSNDGVITNQPTGDEVFSGVAIGTAGVTGEVTSPEGVTPDSATATVNVRQLSELCLSEFLAPQSATREGPVTPACIGCSADNTDNMIDGDEETSASLSIPVGLLLQSSVSAEVYDLGTTRLLAGKQVGFVVSKPMDLLTATLLQDITITTLNCAAGDPVVCTDVQSFSGRDTSAPLYVALLGLLGGESAALVQTDPLETSANGMRIEFSGGLLSALAVLNVNAACAETAPVAAQ